MTALTIQTRTRPSVLLFRHTAISRKICVVTHKGLRTTLTGYGSRASLRLSALGRLEIIHSVPNKVTVSRTLRLLLLADFVLGYYIYIESSSPRVALDYADLYSPLMSPPPRVAGATLSCSVRFCYHMYGTAIGDLTVFLKNADGQQTIWQVHGDQGNRWVCDQVPLDKLIQNINYQVCCLYISINDQYLTVFCLDYLAWPNRQFLHPLYWRYCSRRHYVQSWVWRDRSDASSSSLLRNRLHV